MGDDVDERLLEHVLHVVVISDIARADARQIASIQGIELTHRPFVTVAKSLCYAFFNIPCIAHETLITHILSDKEDGTC